jgi:hypothetical protein
MKRSIIIVLGLLLISITGIFAQNEGSPIDLIYEKDPVFLGITVGYNRVMHAVTLPSFDKEGDLCPKFENGSDNGFWAGITYEHFFGDLSNSRQSLIFRALYSTYPSYLEVGGEEYPTQIRYYDENGNLVSQKIEYSSTMNTQTIKYDVVSFEVSYKIKPIEGINLGITVTPTFDYALTKTYDQRFELIEPQNAQFEVNQELVDDGTILGYTNNDRTIIVNQGDIPTSTAFRLGLKAGIQYEINIPGGFYIVPALYYNFGITNLTSDNDWRVSALQIGIDIRQPIRF